MESSFYFCCKKLVLSLIFLHDVSNRPILIYEDFVVYFKCKYYKALSSFTEEALCYIITIIIYTCITVWMLSISAHHFKLGRCQHILNNKGNEGKCLI